MLRSSRCSSSMASRWRASRISRGEARGAAAGRNRRGARVRSRPCNGTANRRSFAQELGVAFQRLERFGEKFAVASIGFERLGEEVETSADDVLVAALANHLVDLVDQTDFVGCTSSANSRSS